MISADAKAMGAAAEERPESKPRFAVRLDELRDSRPTASVLVFP
jgi:hypothetical protein